MGDCSRSRLHCLTETGKNLGVQAISLGPFAQTCPEGGKGSFAPFPHPRGGPQNGGHPHHPGSFGLPSQRSLCASMVPAIECRRNQLPLALTSRDASSIEPRKSHRTRFDLTNTGSISELGSLSFALPCFVLYRRLSTVRSIGRSDACTRKYPVGF